MKSIFRAGVTLVVVAVITVLVIIFAPRLIPTTKLALIGTVVLGVFTVFAAISSIAVVIDIYHRARRESVEAMPPPEEIASKTYQLYRNLVLRFCDVVDLTELPVLEGTLTLQEFTVRQLYIPLRLLIDSPSTTATTPELNVEAYRSFQRDIEAGREDQRRSFPASQDEISIGSLLDQSKHTVVLGDPGSGKSTLLKWLALALTLREQG